MPQKKLQIVWPKDGHKGKDHRGFFGKMNNCLTNRGPDMFLQKKGSKQPIKPDEWGNWDSYHIEQYYHDECSLGFPYSSRGFQRYDPHTRRYKTWQHPHDWHGYGVDELGMGLNTGVSYPRFTLEDGNKILQRTKRGKLVDPTKMGSEWHDTGPMRFRQEHDWFWQNAHRAGEVRRHGFNPFGRWSGINPNLLMHQNHPDDVNDWINEQFDI